MTGTAATPQAGALNVVLVSVDCMRRDRLSAYGHARRTTPFLDGMLDRALHATSAHSVSCWTCPSVVSLMSGQYPHRHGGGLVPGEPKNLSKHNLPTKASPDTPLLADLLRARGYATAAVGAVWNAHLPVPGRFDEMAMLEKPAPKLTSRSLKWMRAQAGAGRPFFLWLHLGDPHEPLDVPRSLRDVFGPVPKLKNVRTWDYQRSGDDVTGPGFAAYADARVRLYDAAVRAADASLADLHAALASDGLLERTVWVVTADHGEEFWEHRQEELEGFTDPRDIYGVGHGHNMFQVHVLVPLLLFGPGIDPRAVEQNVSLVDVAPTVLQAVGLDVPSDMDGTSLLGGVAPDRPILSEGIAYGFEKASVVQGDLKLLSAPSDRFERLWRLGADRREASVVDDPDAVRRMLGAIPGRQAMGEQVERTDEIEEHLRHLGYIE